MVLKCSNIEKGINLTIKIEARSQKILKQKFQKNKKKQTTNNLLKVFQLWEQLLTTKRNDN